MNLRTFLKKYTPSYWLIVVGIFVLSAGIRLIFLQTIEYKSDEALSLFQMAQFFVSPHLIKQGITSSLGIPIPPLFSYLLLPIVFFGSSPEWVSAAIAFLNSVAIAAFYPIVRKWYGAQVALIASLILATSPWSIILTRKIWPQDILLWFLVPLFYFLHRLMVDRDQRALFPVALLLTLMTQIHLSGLFLAAATAIYFAVQKQFLNKAQVTKGLLIGLIPLTPYVLNQFTTGCPACAQFLSYAGNVRTFEIAHFLAPFQLLGSFLFDTLLGKDYELFQQYSSIVTPHQFISLILIALSLIGAHSIRKHQKKYTFLLYHLFLVSPLLILTSSRLSPSYYVVVLPSLVVATAIGFRYLASKLMPKKMLGSGLLTVGLIISVANIWYVLTFYQFVTEKKVVDKSYGLTIEAVRDELAEVLAPYEERADYDLMWHYTSIFVAAQDLHTYLGTYFMQRGEYDFAITEFNKSVQQSPDAYHTRVYLAVVYQTQNRDQEAQAELQTIATTLRLTPQQIDEVVAKGEQLISPPRLDPGIVVAQITAGQ